MQNQHRSPKIQYHKNPATFPRTQSITYLKANSQGSTAVTHLSSHIQGKAGIVDWSWYQKGCVIFRAKPRLPSITRAVKRRRNPHQMANYRGSPAWTCFVKSFSDVNGVLQALRKLSGKMTVHRIFVVTWPDGSLSILVSSLPFGQSHVIMSR